MVKVSVIVPVYNVYDYLRKCLDSLVNQTLKEIEIIVVNDESPDDSQKIIDEYVKKYENVYGYVKKNGGLSDTRNFGIKKANGEYVTFIDSDDYIDLTMLEKMYNYAKERDLDIVTCDSVKVYDDSDKQIYLMSNLKYSDDDVKNYLISPPMACTRMIKRELFDRINFKKGIFYEDLELTPKLVKYSKKIGFVEEGLYFYLQRSGSIMKQMSFNEKLLDIFKVLDSNYDLLYNEYPDEIEYMYISHLLRTTTLRFLDYDDCFKYLSDIFDIIETRFPKWRENIYYQKSSYKFKILCNLAIRKQYGLLKLIKKVFE